MPALNNQLFGPPCPVDNKLNSPGAAAPFSHHPDITAADHNAFTGNRNFEARLYNFW
jgi:hypothetical protein